MVKSYSTVVYKVIKHLDLRLEFHLVDFQIYFHILISTAPIIVIEKENKKHAVENKSGALEILGPSIKTKRTYKYVQTESEKIGMGLQPVQRAEPFEKRPNILHSSFLVVF